MKQLHSIFVFAAVIQLFYFPLKGEEPPSSIVCQRSLPVEDDGTRLLVQDNACGPCSIINLLSNGTPEMQKLLKGIKGTDNANKTLQIIQEFGSKDSLILENRKRFRIRDKDANGSQSEDLRGTLNELIDASGLTIPNFENGFFQRKKDESEREFLLRGHKKIRASLDRGIPVIADLVSFYTSFHSENGKFLYNRNMGHFVVIVDVQDEIRNRENGFAFTYLDSWTGEREHGYIHLDLQRTINVPVFTGATHTSKDWIGAQKSPFLQITSASLDIGIPKRNWYERTFIIINQLILPKLEN